MVRLELNFMNEKAVIHEFNPQIYPRLLWVTYGCPTEVLKDMFGEKAKDMDEATREVIL